MSNKYSFNKTQILNIDDTRYHLGGDASSKSMFSVNKNHERYYFSCQTRYFEGKAVHRLFDEGDILFIRDAFDLFTRKRQLLFDQWLLMPRATEG